MKKPKLMIGVPAYGGVHPNFMMALTKLLARTTDYCPMLHMVRGDSLVSRARNKITSAFLASDCDVLLQLDTDIEFHPERMRDMLERNEPIIGGMYFLKRLEPIPCANGLPDAIKDRGDGLEQVKFIGTGMLAVHRAVFDAQIEAGLVEDYQADDDEKRGEIWDFWRVGVQTDPVNGRRRYLSEDWFFCLNAAKCGYRVMADKRNIGIHYGEIGFPVQLPDASEGEDLKSNDQGCAKSENVQNS